MHELSIAMNIVEFAQEEAERLGAPVRAVHLKLGPMAGIVKEQLMSSYDIACQDTTLQGSRLVIEDMPLVVYCPRCDANRTLSSPQSLRCLECDTLTPDIIGGRELQIVMLEIDDDS